MGVRLHLRHNAPCNTRWTLNPIAFLTPKALAWIVQQRQMHRPAATPLSGTFLNTVAPLYTRATLERARFRLVEAIENPPFYAELSAIAPWIDLIDFRQMAGITFDDTILIRASSISEIDTTSLIFHELVHVAQYEHLGVSGFAKRYVRGWAENQMRYEAIPLERDAYDLQARFEQHERFSVEASVAQQLSIRGDGT
jgi:hypothetical protein